MKVALVHDHLNQFGGAERVLKVLSELYADAPIHTVLYDHRVASQWFDEDRLVASFIQRFPGSRIFMKWFLPFMPTAIEHLSFTDYAIVVSSSSALIKGILTPPSTLHICYCHTPTRYLWSDTNEYIAELPHPSAVKVFLPFVLHRLRMWDWQAAQRVDRFVANSQFVATRIQKYYGREASVIYPPVDVDLYRPRERVTTEKYFLLISRFRPYKKVDLAITAFSKMNVPLKIIGSGEEESRLRALASPCVEFIGSVDDATKAHYLQHCQALIHPQEEDAGITAIEVMASGRPVIAYDAGGARETVVPGRTGVLFDEQSWECLADTVIRFRAEDFDPNAIIEHAQQFSRARFKREFQAFVDQSWKEFQEGKSRVG